jgi:large subunit ribosomal protein L21
MYAVIQTGGKQYKVSPGDIVRVEQLSAKPGETVELTDVFMVADGDKVSIGKPALASAKVTAEVVREDRGEKLLIFKHRGENPQDHRLRRLTELKIKTSRRKVDSNPCSK